MITALVSAPLLVLLKREFTLSLAMLRIRRSQLPLSIGIFPSFKNPNRGPDPTKFNKDLDKINGWMCLNV